MISDVHLDAADHSFIAHGFKIPDMSDADSRPSGDASEPLYDINVRTPTHAERARTLVAQISTGTLCTLAIEPAGYPYGSFVTVALEKGNPIFLISALAEHTKNLEQDPRASLLVAESGCADPLANGRVTMLRPCTRSRETGAAPAPLSLPRIRTLRTTPTFATSGFGACMWIRSATSEATDGCRGLARSSGTPPRQIPSALQRPASWLT